MPTEHEYKYVLDIKTDEDFFVDNCKRHYRIQQGYLVFADDMACRIRSSVPVENNQLLENEKQWFFTFKKKVSSRVIEIEQIIDERDANHLWDVSINKLVKDRYVVEDDFDWEIDFFKNDEKRYFVLAEVELEEGSSKVELPSFVVDWLKYEVPLTDNRFANTKLSDLEHVSRIYNQLNGVKNDNSSKEKESL